MAHLTASARHECLLDETPERTQPVNSRCLVRPLEDQAGDPIGEDLGARG
jgi:hypothetical protein